MQDFACSCRNPAAGLHTVQNLDEICMEDMLESRVQQSPLNLRRQSQSPKLTKALSSTSRHDKEMVTWLGTALGPLAALTLVALVSEHGAWSISLVETVVCVGLLGSSSRHAS